MKLQPTVLGRPLTNEERRRSQRNFFRFSFVNGASYMCLGENILVLFAAQLGCPNSVVALLGAVVYVGFLLLPLGVKVSAVRGAAGSQADFWTIRNFAALFVACAWFAAQRSVAAASAILVIGAFVFHSCRWAGAVLQTPLIGDITSPDEAPEVIGRSQAWFNASAVATLVLVTVFTTRWHGAGVFSAILAVGAYLGFLSAGFLRGIRESGAIRDAARAPLWHGVVAAARVPVLRRFALVRFLEFLLNMTLLPIAVLALKRGCGFSVAQTLACTAVQYIAGSALSAASGRLCRRFGAGRIVVAMAVCYLIAPLLVVAALPTGPAILPGLVIFLWLGACYFAMSNALWSVFLEVCPEKSAQVPASAAIFFVSGVGAGLLGALASSWLVTATAGWAPRLGCSVFAGDAGHFRLYFLCIVPVAIANLAAAWLLKTKEKP